MTLSRMIIHSFGRFKEVTIDLTPGFNVLYGQNGAGKSTLIQFLLWMLYDPENRKKGIRERIRERFRPWSGEALFGELEFSHQGTPYRMERFFDTSNKKRFAVYHGITGEEVTERFLPVPGVVLFGFGQEAFLRTFFVGQLSTPFEKEGKEDELMAMLMNLQSSGNEAVSAQKALKTLEDAARKLQLKSGHGGKIGAVEAELDRLNQLLDQRRKKEAELHLKAKGLEQVTAALEEQKRARAAAVYTQAQKRAEQRAAADIELSELHESLNRLSIQLEGIDLSRLSDAEEACRIQKTVQGEQLRIAADAETLKIRQLKEEQAVKEAQAAEEKAKKIRIVYGILGILLLIAAFFFIPLAIAGVVLLVLAFLPRKSASAPVIADTALQLQRLEEEQAAFLKQEERAKTTLFEIFGRAVLEEDVLLAGERVRQQQLKTLQYEELQKRRALLSEGEEGSVPAPAEPYFGPEYDEKRFNALLTELGSLTAELESGFGGLPAEHLLLEDIGNVEETLNQLYKKRDALRLAQEFLSETAEEMRHSFGPLLNRAAAEILARLTDGAVSQVRISGEYRMELTDSQGSHALDYFSNGTVDQAYLALRLGMLDLLEKSNQGPLLLDDVFCQYDDHRLGLGLSFLEERSKTQQILYCTCRKETYPFKVEPINLDGLF